MSKGRNLSKLTVSETGGLSASNLSSIVDAAPGALDTLKELATAYPSIVDQLDVLYHGGYDAWREQIQAVKDQFPKPI